MTDDARAFEPIMPNETIRVDAAGNVTTALERMRSLTMDDADRRAADVLAQFGWAWHPGNPLHRNRTEAFHAAIAEAVREGRSELLAAAREGANVIEAIGEPLEYEIAAAQHLRTAITHATEETK